MKLDAVYVVVRDMNSAREFYGRLFDRPPLLVDERFSGFDLEGALFGLFAARFFSEPVDTHGLVYGNNCVANIRVSDVATEWDRVRSLSPPHLTAIQDTGEYRLFQVVDADGNRVEFYQAVERTA